MELTGIKFSYGQSTGTVNALSIRQNFTTDVAVPEWVKGKTVEEALSIKNTDIVRELALPPVKIHCSVLAEDAIKAAIGDWKKKHGIEVAAVAKVAH